MLRLDRALTALELVLDLGRQLCRNEGRFAAAGWLSSKLGLCCDIFERFRGNRCG